MYVGTGPIYVEEGPMGDTQKYGDREGLFSELDRSKGCEISRNW